MAKEEMRLKGERKAKLPACTIDPQVLKDLDKYCEKHGYYRSNVVETALAEYLKKYDKKS